MSNLNIDDAEQAAQLLDDHPDFRVLRALPPLHRLDLHYPEGKLRQAVVLDTETTTLDPATGRIIELAICPVTFDGRGRIVAIGSVYDWLEDPGEPLAPEIQGLTGLTDAMLAGRHIDDEMALCLLANADLIIAHNARFDAGWIEQRYPSIAGKPWCCSMADVDWRGHGYEGRTLGTLLADVGGFFNARHRADADVAALVALLASPLPSGRTVCAEMILKSQRPTVRVIAEGSPFELKDKLKARGYRWDQKIRCWCHDGSSNSADDECAWLAAEGGCPKPKLQQISWHRRHRA